MAEVLHDSDSSYPMGLIVKAARGLFSLMEVCEV